MSCKTWSHMCGSWYFPKFLLRRVINTSIHSLLYVPGDPLCLPVNYGETFGAYWVSCRMAMVVYMGWGPEVFLEPVPEGSARLPYVFFWIVDVWAFKSIYDPILLKFAVPVLGGHEKGFYGVGRFKMHMDPHVVVCPF